MQFKVNVYTQRLVAKTSVALSYWQLTGCVMRRELFPIQFNMIRSDRSTSGVDDVDLFILSEEK